MGKGFITPQAELTWSRLSSDSFAAAAPSGESMRVNQSSVNSLIGRLGVVAGVESDKGNFYAKASLFHEFDGDGHILFSEPGKQASVPRSALRIPGQKLHWAATTT